MLTICLWNGGEKEQKLQYVQKKMRDQVHGIYKSIIVDLIFGYYNESV